MSKLTKKQEAFCREYVIDFNGTQAASRAGYSEKTAKEQGARLLSNVNVLAYIKELTERQSEELEITVEELTNFFRSIMEDEEQKGADRIRAAENLAKRRGYYEEHNKQKKATISPPTIIISD
jgi:phage terminase small subunit